MTIPCPEIKKQINIYAEIVNLFPVFPLNLPLFEERSNPRSGKQQPIGNSEPTSASAKNTTQFSCRNHQYDL